MSADLAMQDIEIKKLRAEVERLLKQQDVIVQGNSVGKITKLVRENALLKSVAEAAEVMTMEGSIDDNGAFSGWCYGMGALQKQLRNWRARCGLKRRRGS